MRPTLGRKSKTVYLVLLLFGLPMVVSLPVDAQGPTGEVSESARNATTPLDTLSSARYFVSIPRELANERLGDKEARTRLHQFVVDRLGAQRSRPEGPPEHHLITLLDPDGRPIRPDWESAQLRSRYATATENELHFTFDSPTHPWTESELETLTTLLDAFYPEIVAVYGPPAFDLSINVRKTPQVWGFYNASLNEIVVRDLSDIELLCHSVIHAFRDELAIGFDTFEEGMTSATEVEVFNRLPQYVHGWREFHSNENDIFYESLNQPYIGAKNGNLQVSFGLGWLREGLAGYAWAKVFLENQDFFEEFNRELYLRMLDDPSVGADESRLREIAAALQASVEGLPFQAWYERQYVFDTDPEAGCFLVLHEHQTMVRALCRDENGVESGPVDQTVLWAIYDFRGDLMENGSCVTGSSGWCDIEPSTYGDPGRMEFVVTANLGGTSVRTSALRGGYYFFEERGVFGVVPEAIDGTVVLTPEDQPPVVLTLDRGTFAYPSLGGYRGQLVADFEGLDGRTATVTFTKDASAYFVRFPDTDLPACNASTEPCIPDEHTLCIDGEPGDRRFEARVRWVTNLGGGSSGDASVVALDGLGIARGGIFYFFDRSNPEILLKVLDGCGVNGHYWVFTSAGTTLGTYIQIRDSSTGCSKTYINGDETIAFPIADPMAFDSCP